jgi:hypothetical protein
MLRLSISGFGRLTLSPGGRRFRSLAAYLPHSAHALFEVSLPRQHPREVMALRDGHAGMTEHHGYFLYIDATDQTFNGKCVSQAMRMAVGYARRFEECLDGIPPTNARRLPRGRSIPEKILRIVILELANTFATVGGSGKYTCWPVLSFAGIMRHWLKA